MRRGHFDFWKPQKFFSLSLLTCASPFLMVQSQSQWVRQRERGGQGREHWWPRMGGWGPEWGELSISAGRGARPARFQPKQGKEGVAVDGRVSRGVWAEHEGVPQEGGVWGRLVTASSILKLESWKDSPSTEPTHRIIKGTGSGLAGVRKPGWASGGLRISVRLFPRVFSLLLATC